MLADVSNCPQKLLRLLKLFRGWGWGRGIRRRWLTKVPEIGNENRSENQPILDLWDNVLYSWILYWEIFIEKSLFFVVIRNQVKAGGGLAVSGIFCFLLIHEVKVMGGDKGGVLSVVVICNFCSDPEFNLESDRWPGSEHESEMQVFENMSRKKWSLCPKAVIQPREIRMLAL